ncbi:MAG: thiamine pyrophosphate-dependent enzyme, partial [Candidatus Omnitrophica bacterium]|nr:thiamine pyrophosphate-dependent enzyme [Candidatus Omnitrophota bacterium]
RSGSNHGAFHESLNFAATQNAPVIFVCENNMYATATPLTTATRNTHIASRAVAYSIPGVAVDGNDVLAVWEAMRQAVERARKGEGPTLIEAKTYRVVGHHEGDPLTGTYRTQEELDLWKTRCPILRYSKWLVAEGLATKEELTTIETDVNRRIQEAIAFAESSSLPDPATATEHVWAEPLHPAHRNRVQCPRTQDGRAELAGCSPGRHRRRNAARSQYALPRGRNR